MKRIRSRLARGLVLWTLLMLVIAALLVLQAAWSLTSAGQACFFDSQVPCPTGNDPAVARLTFAFFDVPSIWLAGVGLVVVRRALLNRRHQSAG